MEYQVYIYGRTLEKDFRTICSPNFADKELEKVEKFVKMVINDIDSEDKTEGLRYAYLFLNDKILWGIGFNNTDMNKDYANDCKGRPLRSFVGILIQQDDFIYVDSIPYSLDFFKRLFDKYIVPVWNTSEYQQWNVIPSETESFWNDELNCALVSHLQLNNDDSSCVIHPVEDSRLMIASVKQCKTNMVTNLSNEAHIVLSDAKNGNVGFCNVSCRETSNVHTLALRNKEKRSMDKTLSEHNKDRGKGFISKIKVRLGIRKEEISGMDDKDLETLKKVYDNVDDVTKNCTSSMNFEAKEGAEIDNGKESNLLLDWGDSWGEEDMTQKEQEEKTVETEEDLMPEQENSDLTPIEIFQNNDEDSEKNVLSDELKNKILEDLQILSETDDCKQNAEIMERIEEIVRWLKNELL